MTFLRRHRASSTTVEPNTPVKSSGFWSIARPLLAGAVGIGVLSLLATLAGSAWLTANQRSEAEKPAPWADPSFTTTAITTGGLISRWTDNDGNPHNGHSYTKGIYSLWKVKHSQQEWESVFVSMGDLARIPPEWQVIVTEDKKAYRNAVQEQLRKTSEDLRSEAESQMIEIYRKMGPTLDRED